MNSRIRIASRRPLFDQLGWFIRLRWLAAAAVLVGAAINGLWLKWYPGAPWMAALGIAILTYNLLLWLVMRQTGWSLRGNSLLTMAWAQLLLDMGSLTGLVLLTGGIQSPLRMFFVFHMVFASLLLPRLMAYGSASVAMLMFAGALWVVGQWPVERDQNVGLLAWVVMLLITVWLANGITRNLRRQRRRLMRQNKRIAAMSDALARQQQAMIQHEKMATAGRMAAGVAHEIANPLASMDSLLQLMERRPEKVRPEAVATLREQIGRINQIVRRMTEFAHPGEARWQVLPLNELVEKALEVIGFDPRCKRVRIERQLAAGAPSVRHLAGTIQQVVINLTINALDAMENVASPRLVIQTGASEGWAMIRITDNGQGIRPEHLPRLFEPFFTTKPVGKGTGLGLSISYSLVEKQGGRIEVSSEWEKGTTFTVWLASLGQNEQSPTVRTAAVAPVAEK